MADKKETFVLYNSFKTIVNMLSDQQAGELFKAIFDYGTDDAKDGELDDLTRMAYTVITEQIARDNDKYNEKCAKNAEIAKKREESRKKENKQEPAKENTNVHEDAPQSTNVHERTRTCTNVHEDAPQDESVNERHLYDYDYDYEYDYEYDYDFENDSSKELKRKTRKRKAPAVPIVYYPEDEKLNKAFEDYVEYRKKAKSPMTEKAVSLAIKKLQELSSGDNDKAILIIEQSIMNGWKGLFELKTDTKAREPSSTVNDWMNS